MAGLTWVLPISRLVCFCACNDVAVVAARHHRCRISLARLKVSYGREGVGNGLGNSPKVLRGCAMSRLVCVRTCNDMAVAAACRQGCRISLALLKVSNWGEGVGNGLGNSQKVLRGRSGSGGCGDSKMNGASWSTTGGWWCCCTEVHYRRLGNVVVAVISVVGDNLPCLVKK